MVKGEQEEQEHSVPYGGGVDHDYSLKETESFPNWAHSICECCSPKAGGISTCTWAWCCDWCIFGQTASMFAGEDSILDVHPWSCVCTGGCWGQFFLVSSALYWLLPLILRNKVRVRYGILDSRTKACSCWNASVDDFLLELLCPPCSRQQVYNTVKENTKQNRGEQFFERGTITNQKMTESDVFASPLSPF